MAVPNKTPQNTVKSNSIDNPTKNPFFIPEEVRNCKQRPSYTILDVVKILLRERAMKQVDLADKIGISRQALHNYLKGSWGTPTQIKIKIAQALNVDSSVIWDLPGDRK